MTPGDEAVVPNRAASVLRRRMPWLVLLTVVVVALTIAAWPDRGTRSAAERVAALSRELRCPDCESLSVAESNTASARALRVDIAERVKAGESDGAIRRVYVDRFGQSILLEPTNDGLGVMLFVLPVLVLLTGSAAVVLALRRWQSMQRLSASDEDRELVRGARRREP